MRILSSCPFDCRVLQRFHFFVVRLLTYPVLKARAAALKVLQSQNVASWGETDVGVWLEENGFAELVKPFVKNGINGEGLASLTEADLVAMKVDKLGVRKGVLKAVATLTSGAKSSVVEKQIVDGSEHSSTSSKSATNGLQFKVSVEGGQNFTLTLNTDSDVSFSKLVRKIENKSGAPPVIRAVLGKEVVPVEDQSEWMPIWSQCKANKAGVELQVRKAGANDLSKAERSMLEGLVDACVVATTDMTILFVNKQLLKATGYRNDEVIGRNVQLLMPADVAKNHASYVNSYLSTGQAKIIGKGRQVALVRKDKSVLSCWLSVTEQKKASGGRHTFLGTLHEIQTKTRSDQALNFSVLDAVQKVVLVIDSTGVLKFLNRHAEKLLGFGEEAVGMNVSALMPQPYSSQHASYLLNYLKSGKPKIIGKGNRTVLAQRKDGSVVAVDLAIDEVSLNGVRHFVGVMKESASEQQEQRSVLQETRGVVNSLSVPAVVIDKAGRIQAFNAMAEALLGFSMVDVLGEKVQCLMNNDDAAKHDSYIANFIRTNDAKVIGKTRLVLAKSVDGNLLPVNLSVSKNVNPDDPEDFLFTGLLVPSQVGLKGEASSESTSYGAAERNYKQMNSAGENTVKACTAVKDFGFAEDPNPAHRSSMEDAWIMMDQFGGEEGSAFFGLYDGHNGIEAAEFAMSKLHLFLIKALKKDSKVLPAMEISYQLTHEAMGSEIAKSGCTAITALLQKSGPVRTIHMANVGDSRAVLVRETGPLRLSKDHKPSDPEEKALSKLHFCWCFLYRMAHLLFFLLLSRGPRRSCGERPHFGHSGRVALSGRLPCRKVCDPRADVLFDSFEPSGPRARHCVRRPL